MFAVDECTAAHGRRVECWVEQPVACGVAADERDAIGECQAFFKEAFADTYARFPVGCCCALHTAGNRFTRRVVVATGVGVAPAAVSFRDVDCAGVRGKLAAVVGALVAVDAVTEAGERALCRLALNVAGRLHAEAGGVSSPAGITINAASTAVVFGVVDAVVVDEAVVDDAVTVVVVVVAGLGQGVTRNRGGGTDWLRSRIVRVTDPCTHTTAGSDTLRAGGAEELVRVVRVLVDLAVTVVVDAVAEIGDIEDDGRLVTDETLQLGVAVLVSSKAQASFDTAGLAD